LEIGLIFPKPTRRSCADQLVETVGFRRSQDFRETPPGSGPDCGQPSLSRRPECIGPAWSSIGRLFLPRCRHPYRSRQDKENAQRQAQPGCRHTAATQFRPVPKSDIHCHTKNQYAPKNLEFPTNRTGQAQVVPGDVHRMLAVEVVEE